VVEDEHRTNLERQAEAARRSSRLKCPKPRSEVSPKQWALGSTMPSWRSGKTHGFCVTGGHSPIAPEPTPSLRLWATTPGATPTRLCQHNMGIPEDPKNRNFLSGSKEELSTWLRQSPTKIADNNRRADQVRSSAARGCIDGGAIIDHMPPRERRLVAVEK
jgi:hypothetical protein